jgi:alkylation response protein AidB-like acyl-CoA dehydrogenase
MNFDLTKEQQLLSDAVHRFVAKEYSFAAREAILDSKEGWSREIWAKLAELGLLGLQVPDEHGGMGSASVETMLTMNVVGRGLLLEPYLPSAILATALIRDLGSPAQKEELLPAMAAGERIAVPAHGEPGTRDERARVATTAVRSGDGFVLNGRKAVVLHAAGADALLISARTSGAPGDPRGISLFIVARGAQGVSLQTYRTLDGQRASDVSLRDVRVPAGGLLGPEGGAFEAISAAWDLGVAAICAEAAGALQALLDSTVEYAKTRKQFGVPIGKFQALQHRMVEMLIHVEQARSMSYLAAIRATDPDGAERRRAVSAAKVVIGQACRKVAQEAVQIHGGMGMTDELHVGHYFKRLTAIELSLGDTEHHLESFVRETAARKEIA